jgi:hypothetical protein
VLGTAVDARAAGRFSATVDGRWGVIDGAPNGGYLRWADGAEMDTIGLLVVADASMPALFNRGVVKVGWSRRWN